MVVAHAYQPSAERLRQEDLKFKDSLEDTARACLNFKNKKKELRHSSAFLGVIKFTAHPLIPNFPLRSPKPRTPNGLLPAFPVLLSSLSQASAH